MRSTLFSSGSFHGFYYFSEMRSLRLPNGVVKLLTPIEARLWLFLTAGEGKIWSKQILYKACFPADTTIKGRSLDSHICRLRSKLGPYHRILQSIYGRGYRISMDD
ncbi:MAG: winged helix-turn-helix domain-containing protein [Candidatus Enteromonas sp.]|nr:winged helix-turn-helix domain-containing protein [Candidatus Enteromonas sp.]